MSPPDRLELLLVHSKLERPYLPRGLVQRGSVKKQLAQSLDQRVTLVSAPAGYGKSHTALGAQLRYYEAA